MAGDDDTFAFCGKKKSIEERENVAKEKGAKLLHTDSKFKYFKVPFAKGKKIQSGQTQLACEKVGLKAACPGDEKCQYATKYSKRSRCVITPLSPNHKNKRGCGYL